MPHAKTNPPINSTASIRFEAGLWLVILTALVLAPSPELRAVDKPPEPARITEDLALNCPLMHREGGSLPGDPNAAFYLDGTKDRNLEAQADRSRLSRSTGKPQLGTGYKVTVTQGWREKPARFRGDPQPGYPDHPTMQLPAWIVEPFAGALSPCPVSFPRGHFSPAGGIRYASLPQNWGKATEPVSSCKIDWNIRSTGGRGPCSAIRSNWIQRRTETD